MDCFKWEGKILRSVSLSLSLLVNLLALTFGLFLSKEDDTFLFFTPWDTEEFHHTLKFFLGGIINDSWQVWDIDHTHQCPYDSVNANCIDFYSSPPLSHWLKGGGAPPWASGIKWAGQRRWDSKGWFVITLEHLCAPLSHPSSSSPFPSRWFFV